MTKKQFLKDLAETIVSRYGDKRPQTWGQKTPDNRALKIHWLGNAQLDVILSEIEYMLYQNQGTIREREVIKLTLELQCVIDKMQDLK